MARYEFECARPQDVKIETALFQKFTTLTAVDLTYLSEDAQGFEKLTPEKTSFSFK